MQINRPPILQLKNHLQELKENYEKPLTPNSPTDDSYTYIIGQKVLLNIRMEKIELHSNNKSCATIRPYQWPDFSQRYGNYDNKENYSSKAILKAKLCSISKKILPDLFQSSNNIHIDLETKEIDLKFVVQSIKQILKELNLQCDSEIHITDLDEA